MNISHIWHLFCPFAYLLSLCGFFALYLSHIPLHAIHYIMMMYRCALCKKSKRLTVRYVSFDDVNNGEPFALAMCNDCWSYAMKEGLSDKDIATIKNELI